MNLVFLEKSLLFLVNLQINIVSVLVYPAKDENDKVLVFRIQTMNPLKVIDALEAEGYRVLWPNIMGMQHEQRLHLFG